MYPLVRIGPFNLGSGALLLLAAVFVGQVVLSREIRARGGERLAKQSESCFFAALLGAFVGGRLVYGLLNWDIYGSNPGLFLALQLGALAWPGAFVGGALAAYLLVRQRGLPGLLLADSAALALPVGLAFGSVGLLLSGEAFGVPTALPWGIELLGTTRHPTQVYLLLAALASLGGLHWLKRRPLPEGALLAAFLGLHGLTLLLVGALRADSLLLPGGLRASQVFGLVLLLAALWWARAHAAPRGAAIVAPPAPES
jgi:phosphatidylglycerol:prolipoprotein diacylglycerol transferase